MKKSLITFLTVFFVANFSFSQNNEPNKPNVVLIMLDDMGYSDLGCYGGEIETPTIDKLASEGIRFSNFYNTGRCCPSRASLLTGLYPHKTGIGFMTFDSGSDYEGYRGVLNNESVTIGEVLQKQGYHTSIVGKWHVGSISKKNWPLNRGFNRFYGSPQAGGSYYGYNTRFDMVLDDKIIYPKKSNSYPENWYSTNAFTDKAIEFIDDAISKGKPFFTYMAYNAPHYNLQAPEDVIENYMDFYRKGWDSIRESRYKKLLKEGLINSDWKQSEPERPIKEWNSLSAFEKEKQIALMAVYAATIEMVDRNISKLITSLKEKNVLENTVIMLLSDNGGCKQSKGEEMGSLKIVDRVGGPKSYAAYGISWANVSNTPFRKFKTQNHEGGIASPLIIWGNKIADHQKEGTINKSKTHIIDIMPTILDVTQSNYPKKFNENIIKPIDGKSILPLLKNVDGQHHEYIYFEHQGNKAIINKSWKLVALKNKPWELYNIEKDRTELNNLSQQYPNKVNELSIIWNEWATNNNVLPKPKIKGPSTNWK